MLNSNLFSKHLIAAAAVSNPLETKLFYHIYYTNVIIVIIIVVSIKFEENVRGGGAGQRCVFERLDQVAVRADRAGRRDSKHSRHRFRSASFGRPGGRHAGRHAVGRADVPTGARTETRVLRYRMAGRPGRQNRNRPSAAGRETVWRQLRLFYRIAKAPIVFGTYNVLYDILLSPAFILVPIIYKQCWIYRGGGRKGAHFGGPLWCKFTNKHSHF